MVFKQVVFSQIDFNILSILSDRLMLKMKFIENNLLYLFFFAFRA